VRRLSDPPPTYLFSEQAPAVGVLIGIGFVVGFGALLCLRAARLRFAWALWGAPLAYLSWQFDWRVGLALAWATVIAAGAGFLWHLQDLERGGEDAQRARESVGVARWLWSRLRAGRVGERRLLKGRIALGVTTLGTTCWVPFGHSRGVHALVLGATGSGKTVTQAAIAQIHILAGLPAIVIDPKGDSALRAVLRDAAERAGMAFREWSPAGSTIYNPLERGGPTEIADKALIGQRWTEPHYELATQRLLGKVLLTMRAGGQWPPTISGIVANMDPERLDALATQVGGEVAENVASYVDGLSARAKADLGGGRDRLAVLAEGELGPRLDPALGEGELLSFERSLREGEVVYFHLDADRYPAASKLLAAALVSDLVTLTASLQEGELRGLLVIDEFAALAAAQVSRLFARARSAGLSLLLGTQSLADLRGADPDDPSDAFTEQVFTNVTYTVVHREADPDSAERLARMAGTRPSWSVTRRVGRLPAALGGIGEGTRTREREFEVLPDQIKRLPTGQAVVINPTAKRPAEVVKIWPSENPRR